MINGIVINIRMKRDDEEWSQTSSDDLVDIECSAEEFSIDQEPELNSADQEADTSEIQTDEPVNKEPQERGLQIQPDVGVCDPTPSLDPALRKIAELRSRELSGDQRSADWLSQRNNYITASTSAACAGLMGKVARKNMIKEKIGQGKSFFGNVYTRKGNLFEPVTNMIYSKKTSKTIHMFNLIPATDPEWGFLGASTDGVTNTLDNIEIKTLARREIGKVKREYHHQMQHQMFCLDLQQTHFIEAKYDEFDGVEGWHVAKAHVEFHGAIVELADGTCVYSPIDVPDAAEWASDIPGVKTTYWILTDYQCVTVPRDPSWIQSTGPLLKAFWADVLHYRAHPEEMPDPNINLTACML